MSVYYVVQVLGSIGANPEALQTDTSISPWKRSCGLTSNNGPDLGRENCIIFKRPRGDFCPHIAPHRLKYLGRRIAREWLGLIQHMGPTYGPHHGPRMTQQRGSHKWAPLWTHKWVPPYVGPTEPIICGPYYSFSNKKNLLTPIKSTRTLPTSLHIKPNEIW